MNTTQDRQARPERHPGIVGHAGDPVPANGTYRCLCCGVVLWRARRGRRFPECPSSNCPTMWLWSEP